MVADSARSQSPSLAQRDAKPAFEFGPNFTTCPPWRGSSRQIPIWTSGRLILFDCAGSVVNHISMAGPSHGAHDPCATRYFGAGGGSQESWQKASARLSVRTT